VLFVQAQCVEVKTVAWEQDRRERRYMRGRTIGRLAACLPLDDRSTPCMRLRYVRAQPCALPAAEPVPLLAGLVPLSQPG